MRDPCYSILAINTGSTSTKLAFYENDRRVDEKSLRHEPLMADASVWDSFEVRLEATMDWIRKSAHQPNAVVSIGGLLRPVEGGVYRVNTRMIEDARAGIQGVHASNMGCVIAQAVADSFGCQAFVVDPVSVDEFEPLARYSGHPLIERRTLSHALNIHDMARRAAAEMNVSLAQSAFVIAHLGGGISVAAVKGGRIIDVNDASSDGPFSPERTGGLPLQQFISLCYSGQFSEAEMRTFVMGRGGLVAYLGTNSAAEVEQRIAAGDRGARLVYEAMAYQIAKEIGAMATVLYGKVNAIALGGGLVQSDLLVGWIRERVSSIAPILVYPSDGEMHAMVTRLLAALRGEEPIREYR